ncbi:MAG: AzlC family ABC transporter permease [Oscillospiraceae bacterium]
MKEKGIKTKALKAAFPYTVPILTGFLFLGTAYGIYMNTAGFSPLYPILISITVFAGSMQFVAVSMLQGAFDPLGALLMTIMVNARHLFYGISMLGKYKDTGAKKWYLVFGLCDETFSVNCAVDVPQGVDRGWFYFFVTLLNQLYWVTGAAVGGLLGSMITFELKGLDFVMTALLVVIFLDNWLKEKQHISSLLGLGASLACLLLFGADGFIIPAMAATIAILTFFRKPIEAACDKAKAGEAQ